MMMNKASGIVGRQGPWRKPCIIRTITSGNSNHSGNSVNNKQNNKQNDNQKNNKSFSKNTTTASSTPSFDTRPISEPTSSNQFQYKYSIPQPAQKETPILKPGFQPTGISRDGVYVGSTFLMLSPQTLPELDVAPLLNKTVVTKMMGTSRHGSDAAIRLYKSKNELRQVIHQELCDEGSSSYSKNNGSVKKMYIMRRHGVPNQLLQHLVTVADRWLEQKSALELWVDSSCQSSLSVFTTEGASWRTLWPTEWDNDVALYLAVMKRMVSHLGSMTPFCEGASVLPGDLEWKLSISRHNKLPLTLFPNTYGSEVLPVVEWVNPTPTEQQDAAEESTTETAETAANSKAPRKIGKILIRMQGATNPINPVAGEDYLKQFHDVSFTFEANFDTTNMKQNEWKEL